MRTLYLYLLAAFAVPGQGAPPSLASYFQSRLATPANSPRPYPVLAVVDTIPKADRSQLEAALPLIRAALSRGEDEVARDAAFALTAVAGRDDGPAILARYMPDVIRLLDAKDERLVGGAVIVFHQLAARSPDTILPVIRKYTEDESRPLAARRQLMGVMLDSGRMRPEGQVAADKYLNRDLDRTERIRALQSLGARGVTSPKFVELIMNSLREKDSQVRIAAIIAAAQFGDRSEVWAQARPLVSAMAANAAEDIEVRRVAGAALDGTIFTKPPRPPSPPYR